MKPSIPHTLIYAALAAVISFGAVSAPALAQSSETDTAAKSSVFPQQLQREAQQIVQRLNDIKKKAIASDPKLQAQRRQLAKRVIELMHKRGYKPEEERKQLVALKKEIESGQLSKETRAEKAKEFLAIRAQLVGQQQEAIRDESLRQDRQALSEATTMAMKKQDSKTEELLKRLGEISQQIQKLRQSQSQP